VRFNKRAIARWSTLCLAVSVLVGAVFVTADGRDTSTITVRLLGDIRQLDAAASKSMHEKFVLSDIHAKLVRFISGTSEVEPDIAERWEVSADGKDYTFYLRDGVTFQKGYGPCTASDVKFTFDRIVENHMAESAYYASLESVEVVDDLTVVFHLSGPDSAFFSKIAYTSGNILSQRAFEDLGDRFSQIPVGAGPYEFVEWIPNEEIRLKRFEDYYGPAPAIPDVVFKIITDETSAALALEAGELDFAIVRSQETVDLFKNNPDYVVDIIAGTSIRMMPFNLTKPPVSDLRVRQAIAHAIDRDMLQAVLGDTVSVSSGSLFNSSFFGYTDDFQHYDFDPATARSLLAEAGYPDGFDLPITSTQLAPWPDILPVVQANLRDVGINVTVTLLEHSTYNVWRLDGDYLFTVIPLGRPPHPDFLLSLAFVSSESPPEGLNLSFYNGVDLLIEAARIEPHTDLSLELYKIIQQKIAYDLPVIPIGTQNVIAIYKSDIGGWKPTILNDCILRDLYYKE
jgi:peptide/nickel transport system substrate-binding protein